MKQTEELFIKSIDQKIVDVLRSVLGKKNTLFIPLFLMVKKISILKNV